MKPSTRLSSVVFQLTPTRTRFDLVIIAKDKREKIASGLLNPFLAHLKTAQDQIAKGGYSILLEPDSNDDTPWFTKATVERFVRFVNTPEILERVYTLETEILQIEEAITTQANSDLENTLEEDSQCKQSGGSYEGNKSVDANEEKAIVLYTPVSQQTEVKAATSEEGNSRLQLMKILETRKTVLQKEQGMAFARAAAAGFDTDLIAQLLSFAECFRATRLLDACTRFLDLWKKKHETGQWLEIEATEASQSDISPVNASGIMFPGMVNKKNDSNIELTSDNNRRSCSDVNTGERAPTDHSFPPGPHEYYQGQFPHLMFPPWPMNSPPGVPPVFQAYPVQGMPYYQNYQGNGQFYQPPYPPMEHSPSVGHQPGSKRQSTDGRDSNLESEIWETDISRTQDDVQLGKEFSHTGKARKKSGRSGKKDSGMVIIRNINYVTSKVKGSGNESISASGSETDREDKDSEADDTDINDKNALRSSKIGHSKYTDELNSHDGKETEVGHWEAFQNCLLRGADKDVDGTHEGIFSMEKDVKIKRRIITDNNDPLALRGRDSSTIQDSRINDIHGVNGDRSRRPRESNNEVLLLRADNDLRQSGQKDMLFTEGSGRNIVSRTSNDDFMIGSRENFSGNSLDPLAANSLEFVTNKMERDSHNMVDEAFIVPFRSMSIEQDGLGNRNAIDIDSEFPSAHAKAEGRSNGARGEANYEPDGLSLLPERGAENMSIGYDPALDYEMQVSLGGSKVQEKKAKEMADPKAGLKKLDKDRRSRVISDTSGKQKTGGPVRKVRSSKMSALEDARARAERLRSFKADIQRMKKEQEEAEHKRLEALKLERQKRIAARGSSMSAKSLTHSPQTKKLPTKLSPIANRGSKFSDSEPGSSSPLQRSKVRTSLVSSEPQKGSKVSRSIDNAHLVGNTTNKVVSASSEPKKERNGLTPDSKASMASKVSMARIRRLSEPKLPSKQSVTPLKARSAEVLPKRKLSEGPERNKISAILNLDRSKAATLPELKIKTSKVPLNAGQNRTAAEETLNANETKPSISSEDAELYMKKPGMGHESNVDDNPIIEKTVVVFENEKPSQEKMGLHDQRNDNRVMGEKKNMTFEFAAAHAPPSLMNGAARDQASSQSQYSNSHEVRKVYTEKDPPNFANTITAEKPYQAPYARVSSLEDPCTGNSEYAKAPPTTTDILQRDEEITKARVLDVTTLRVEKNPEISGKAHVKESSKGFRRLLKFGKKNITSAINQSFESDNTSVDGFEQNDNARNTASSSEVHTLKNLISRDETPSAGNASQKTSRHFSLFSPFRSKANEKKLAS